MRAAPIRLGLIGAGIFAQDAHAPALRAAHERYHVAVVYSRARESAARLAATFAHPVHIETDLDAALSRDDIDAVDIVLPIDLMPLAVEKALRAGKHVISEKPIAPDVATGKHLCDLYAHHPHQVWLVSENWRYEAAFRLAADWINQRRIGRVVSVQWALQVRLDPSKPYFHTAWRQKPAYQGGYVLDGGVHHVAALRMLFGDIASVSAFAASIDPALPPLDTMTAVLQFESGVLGTYAITYAAPPQSPSHLIVIGDEGTLRVDRTLLEVARDGQTERHEIATGHSRSIPAMFEDFAAVVQGERSQVLGTPREALGDVAVVEALLRAAADKRVVEVDRMHA
jgi:predicted dehydrogenase